MLVGNGPKPAQHADKGVENLDRPAQNRVRIPNSPRELFFLGLYCLDREIINLPDNRLVLDAILENRLSGSTIAVTSVKVAKTTFSATSDSHLSSPDMAANKVFSSKSCTSACSCGVGGGGGGVGVGVWSKSRSLCRR